MKILHINNSDCRGGASRVARDLHLGLLENKIDSNLVVQEKKLKLKNTFSFLKKHQSVKFNREIANWPKTFFPQRKKTPMSFNLKATNLLQLIKQAKIDYDILHLHWINEGMFNLNEIRDLQKPIVVTMHDDWWLTGGCHLNFDCQKFISGCGSCPQLHSFLKKDPTFLHIRKKKEIFSNLKNIYFVAPSQFLQQKAQKSFCLTDKKIFVINNGVNQKNFYPVENIRIKKKLNLPINKKILFFNASAGFSDSNKNFQFLRNNLEKLKNKNDYLLLILSNENLDNFDFNYKILKPTRNLSQLNLFYNASDLVLLTSLSESFSLTTVEAMACQKPVLSFKCGGVENIIQHKKNGFLIDLNSWEQFQEGLDFIFSNYQNLKKQTYKDYQNNYTFNKMIQEYLKLYQKILKF